MRVFADEHSGYMPESQLQTDSPTPVDRELVRKFYVDELLFVQDEWIAYLISVFRDWRQAARDVMLEGAGASGTTEELKLDKEVRRKVEDVLRKGDRLGVAK